MTKVNGMFLDIISFYLVFRLVASVASLSLLKYETFDERNLSIYMSKTKLLLQLRLNLLVLCMTHVVTIVYNMLLHLMQAIDFT